ncbi:MAG TPA: oligosaccharide flippase family protein [Anaerolineaceae bacterium]
MRSQINRLGKELLLVGLGQAVAAVGSLVGVRLMTGRFDPAAYGEVALAITFVTLSQQLLIGPLSAALTRFLNVAQEKRELPGFLGSSASLALKISLAMSAFTLVGTAFLALSGRSATLGLAGFTLVFALLSGVNILLDAIQTAARQRAVVAWHQGIGQWLRYLGAVGMALVFGGSPAAALAGYALSALLVLLSQTFFFQRKIGAELDSRPAVDPVWTARLLRYTLPFTSWGIFTWLQITSDRWALQTFSSTQAVGYYAVLYQLGYYPLMMLTNVFVQFADPVLFRQAGDGTQQGRIDRAQRNTLRLLAGALVLTGLVFLGALLFHHLIFDLFAAEQYRQISGYLPIMALSGGLFACGQIASTSQLNRGEPQALLVPKIVMGIAGTLFNLAGARWMGLPGVVYANLTFSALYFLWTVLIFNGRRPNPGLLPSPQGPLEGSGKGAGG